MSSHHEAFSTPCPRCALLLTKIEAEREGAEKTFKRLKRREGIALAIAVVNAAALLGAIGVSLS
jgi:hypothetical protein